MMRGNKEVFTERAQSLPNIQKVAYSSGILGMIDGYNNLEIDGRTVNFASVWVDAAFIELYDLNLLKGRFFRKRSKR